MSNSHHRPIAGSHRSPVPDAKVVGDADPNQIVEITIRLRARPDAELPQVEIMGALPPREREHLTRAEYAAAYGALPEDIEAVSSFAKQMGLTVVHADSSRRSVILAGPVSAMTSAFATELKMYDSPRGKYRGREGALHLPPPLNDIVEGVFGLDDRMQAKPHIVLPHREITAPTTRALLPGFTPDHVAQLYNFPSDLDGAGQCIGILEFGGGFDLDDLKIYFQSLGRQVPHVTAISVGARNSPGQDHGADGEVMLDIEIAGAIAPAAKIVVYFAPFTEKGWIDALSAAVHDDVNRPSVLSISWGFAEGKSTWTNQAVQAVNQVLETAAAVGVTVCAASGDDGSADDQPDGAVHADFPASSPYVLACGGTTITVANSQIVMETVWNRGPRTRRGGGASGGGVSDMFPKPEWQINANVPKSLSSGKEGRGIPDVAGNADGHTGYSIRVNGRNVDNVGGTSAVAPLWAGLIALLNQALGKPVGYLNPLLYKTIAPQQIFNDISLGTNDTTGKFGGYAAAVGWDPCTGWGTPDGIKLFEALR